MLKKKTFWRDNILATLFVFGIMGFLASLSNVKLFDAFNPIEETFSDLEMTDIVFSQIRNNPPPDTNIVLINIGNLPRAGIARQLEIIRQHKPQAVGFDVFFFNPTADTLGDLYLSQQLAQTKNLVMAARLERDDQGEFTVFHHSDSLFIHSSEIGFANLNTNAAFQQDYKTSRVFPVSWQINGQTFYPFSIELARLMDPDKTEKFLARGNETETINYRGNVADIYRSTHTAMAFYALDAEEVLREEFNPDMIRDKVVIFGYLGNKINDTSWDDRFYTPLNKKYAGKTNPDMFGAVIHANIISMILHEDYINTLNDKQGWGLLLAIFLCFINITVFSIVHYKYHDYYDVITKSMQVLEVLLLLYLSIIALNYFSFKLGLTVSITAIILSGDLLEIYYNSFGPIKSRLRKITLYVRSRRKPPPVPKST
jgi:CHASE2 domain-containing sensor protein